MILFDEQEAEDKPLNTDRFSFPQPISRESELLKRMVDDVQEMTDCIRRKKLNKL